MNVLLSRRPDSRQDADGPELSAVSAPTLDLGDIVTRTRQTIYNRLMREVEAMALFAMGDGLAVPTDVMAVVDAALGGHDDGLSDRGTAGGPAQVVPVDRFLRLADAHAALSRVVAPARPATLLMLLEDRLQHPISHGFGGARLVRQMMAVAIFSLLALLGIALSSEVTALNMSKGLLNLSGYALLVNEAFLTAAAGVGAALTNLKILDRYVATCTYDPRHDSSYWTRLAMGLISGTVLSQIVYGELAGPTSSTGLQDTSILSTVGQPVLAVLGGFSADLVHDLLMHLIRLISQAFGRGGPQEQTAPASARPPN